MRVISKRHAIRCGTSGRCARGYRQGTAASYCEMRSKRASRKTHGETNINRQAGQGGALDCSEQYRKGAPEGLSAGCSNQFPVIYNSDLEVVVSNKKTYCASVCSGGVGRGWNAAPGRRHQIFPHMGSTSAAAGRDIESSAANHALAPNYLS
jgi:hypothetical protein